MGRIMDQQDDASLIATLVNNQQKTIDHLLDMNAQLVNLAVSMYMPTPVSGVTAPDTPIPDEEVDAALAGGMNS